MNSLINPESPQNLFSDISFQWDLSPTSNLIDNENVVNQTNIIASDNLYDVNLKLASQSRLFEKIYEEPRNKKVKRIIKGVFSFVTILTGAAFLIIPSMPFVIAGASIIVGYGCALGTYKVIKKNFLNKTK